MAALLEAREVRVDLVQLLAHAGADIAARISAGEKVLLHGEVLEAVPPLHDLADAALDERRRIKTVDTLAPVEDLPLRDVAALGAQEARDGLQRRRLSRTVRAEQRHDLPFAHLERHAP